MCDLEGISGLFVQQVTLEELDHGDMLEMPCNHLHLVNVCMHAYQINCCLQCAFDYHTRASAAAENAISKQRVRRFNSFVINLLPLIILEV